MAGYYADRLAGKRLLACYELAPSDVQAYLEAEIDFVLERTSSSSIVLELGCGYGRVLRRIARKARAAVGIDTSLTSLRMARQASWCGWQARLLAMNAARMGFADRVFDLTICVQNGVSAFAVDPQELIEEALRVTRRGGIVLFSSYAAGFWPLRLRWFELQAAHGLIGAIDYDATGDGVIVGADGFRATTIGPDGFAELASRIGLPAKITEVANSSVFCEFAVP